MSSESSLPTRSSNNTSADYRDWLADLKTRFRQTQLKAAVAVNTELLQFDWQLGADIAAQQASQRWGSGFLNKLSQDLMAEFPEMKGFSKRNLEQIRRWHQFWESSSEIAKQAASQLTAIPWGHHLAIVSKDQLVAEYALSDNQKTLGLATDTLSGALPEGLRGQLPSVEALEEKLKEVGNE